MLHKYIFTEQTMDIFLTSDIWSLTNSWLSKFTASCSFIVYLSCSLSSFVLRSFKQFRTSEAHKKLQWGVIYEAFISFNSFIKILNLHLFFSFFCLLLLGVHINPLLMCYKSFYNRFFFCLHFLGYTCLKKLIFIVLVTKLLANINQKQKWKDTFHNLATPNYILSMSPNSVIQ